MLRAKVFGLFIVIYSLVLGSSQVYAQYSSPSFRINEAFVGSGGQIDANSPSFISRSSLGDLVVGSGSSTNYQVYGGFTTTSDEYLEFYVNGGVFDLGEITTTATSSAVLVFSVRNFLATGYSVKVFGTPPTKLAPDHPLDALTTTTSSIIGTEQFGVNVVDNATPNIGANVVQIPDSSIAFGLPASGYGTPDQYKFNDGDIVAQSTKSSGTSTYTMSMIANASAITPAGRYDTTLSLVAVPSF
jgi:hypothetical protein